ncbi:PilT protein [Candidatus Magnetoovum chiemensis]|nr:PilT protein [Candidatus Magnetoovum chiemensis]
MSVNYTINADVVDIRSDSPRASDVFFIDTNVWYWMTYPNASISDTPAKHYQTKEYPAYVKKALNNKSKLRWSGLSIAELSHIIEKTERDIFNHNNKSNVGTKEFRHSYQEERSNVVNEITIACNQVKTFGECIDTTIDNNIADSVLSKLSSYKLDGYDMFILETLLSCGILNIITDDGDFSTIPNISIFTANDNVIKSARKSGRLITR